MLLSRGRCACRLCVSAVHSVVRLVCAFVVATSGSVDPLTHTPQARSGSVVKSVVVVFVARDVRVDRAFPFPGQILRRNWRRVKVRNRRFLFIVLPLVFAFRSSVRCT